MLAKEGGRRSFTNMVLTSRKIGKSHKTWIIKLGPRTLYGHGICLLFRDSKISNNCELGISAACK